jgi:hypothetical protein
MVDRIVTFEQAAPRRPAEADILAGTKENATPVVPPNCASAEEWEQMARLLVSLGRMVPLIRATVTVATPTTPVLEYVTTVRGDLSTSDFTVYRYANGDYELRYSAALFPAPTSRPIVSLNGGTAYGGYRAPDAVITAPSAGVAGVRVRTWDASGSLIAAPFTLQVF